MLSVIALALVFVCAGTTPTSRASDLQEQCEQLVSRLYEQPWPTDGAKVDWVDAEFVSHYNAKFDKVFSGTSLATHAQSDPEANPAQRDLAPNGGKRERGLRTIRRLVRHAADDMLVARGDLRFPGRLARSDRAIHDPVDRPRRPRCSPSTSRHSSMLA